LTYLKEIVNGIIELNPELSRFLILIHKLDPDLQSNKEILENIQYLENRIKNINPEINFAFYKTSIFDDLSLIKAFSDGAISITQRSKLIHTLLKEYTKKTFSSAAVLLDQQSFIIASRSTNESYQQICESIAPRLAYTIEKLEDWDIDTVDIVTNIRFPESVEANREGIIFLRKLDVKNERLYLVSLCLNKKIQVKSYEYLPQLAENLKNLLESY